MRSYTTDTLTADTYAIIAHAKKRCDEYWVACQTGAYTPEQAKALTRARRRAQFALARAQRALGANVNAFATVRDWKGTMSITLIYGN